MSAYPIFKPVFHLYINAENSELVSSFESGKPGKRIFVQIHEGYCDSTDEHYPFNIKITSGTNWLFLTPDNVLTLDVRLRAETEDGHGVYIHYEGYTKPTPAMNAIFAGTGSHMEFGETEFFIKPIIETDAPKEGWVNNKFLIGKGRFVRNEQGVMGAEYYISMAYHFYRRHASSFFSWDIEKIAGIVDRLRYVKRAMGFLTPHLPQYQGPFTVGSVEIEVPSPWPMEYRAIDTSIETLQFRVFYPCAVSDLSTKSHPYWFPENRREYLKSYVTFLGKSSTLASLLSWTPFVPDIVLPCLSNEPLLNPPGGHKWSVMVFSHGLGGTRNAYSQFCGSIASHGIIVIAPEHRDRSAPVTFVRDFSKEGNVRKAVNYRRIMEVNEEARILRTYQLVQRVREIKSIVKILLDQKLDLVPMGGTDSATFDWSNVDTNVDQVIYAGHSFGAATSVALVKGVHYLLEFLYQVETDAIKSNATGEESVPDYKWEGTIDRNDEFLRPAASPAIVLLDPWCIPIYETMGIPLNIPVISIMSQAFYAWKSNMALVYQLLSNSACPRSAPPPPKVQLYLTKPSAHHSQSDFALLFPNLTKYAFKVPECTYATQAAVMASNVNGCVEFLRHLGFKLFSTTDDKEGLVKVESKEENNNDIISTVSTGYLIADGETKGWSMLEVQDNITVVDILEDNR